MSGIVTYELFCGRPAGKRKKHPGPKAVGKESALQSKAYEICYIETPDIERSLDAVRRERVDKDGNEIWFDMLMGFFINSPYARGRTLKQYEDLLIHLRHRQTLELRICREVFSDKLTVIRSRAYDL